jgi:hypothetical protein
MNNPQQSGKYDAVLGGNSPSLEGAAVLGGIEGVKLRLKNPDAKVRIAALEQALNYGEQGLDLVIAGLNDESVEVQNKAYLLLDNLLLIPSPHPVRPGNVSDKLYRQWEDDEIEDMDDEYDEYDENYKKIVEERKRKWEEPERIWEEKLKHWKIDIRQLDTQSIHIQCRQWEIERRQSMIEIWTRAIECRRPSDIEIRLWEQQLQEWDQDDKKWEKQLKQWEKEEKNRLRENAIEEALSKIEDRWLEEEKKRWQEIYDYEDDDYDR